MDGQQPSFELPTPVGTGQEVASKQPGQGVVEVQPVASPEVRGGQPAPSAMVQTVATPSFDPQQATQVPVQALQPSQLSPVSPSFADDVDVIEKEWVKRAKVIVDMTRDDPYQQNKQLSVYKADYVRKRYNKEIKVAD